jgi:hypothetical protein
MAAQTEGADVVVAGRLNIGRGLFRLWLVLSVFWLIAVCLVHRPPACRYTAPGSPIQSLAPHDLFHCLSFLYWGAMLDKVAVLQPAAQEGLRWDDLTEGQRTYAIYRILGPSASNKAAQSGSDDEDWSALWAKMQPNQLLAQANAHPEQFRYQLMPLKDARSLIAEWSHPLGFDYSQELLEFLAVTFGIPLAVGCGGFLSIQVSRWIWRGFAAPP